jgi:hypothetical protein
MSKSALASDRGVQCEICDGLATDLIASERDVAREIDLRRSFFLSRLNGPVDERDLRDLTEMTTNDGEAIYRCAKCDVLVRSDPNRTPTRFACDEYDERTLRTLHDVHVKTFVAKEHIRALLPRGSRVLEIGSYVGGFLEASRRWGWNATGVDIGRDTAAFARANGFDVTTERFERIEFEPQSFDAVFIWNCFEQMPNPAEVIAIVTKISKPGAPLVVYVPDGAVYAAAQRAFAQGEPREEISPIVQQLAYNNLLGLPHHFGYSATSLTRTIASCGYTTERLTNIEAIRPLRDKMTEKARDEEKRVEPAWLELVARKT